MPSSVLWERVLASAPALDETAGALGVAPESLRDRYRVRVLDGNCLEATEHRLHVLRTTAAGPLPGKSLVVYDPAVEMAIDVFPCEDGHPQERALLGEVVPTVQAGDLWIMDRNFCVRAFLTGIAARAGKVICRHHQGLPVTALAPERFVGSIETGKVYEQQVEVLVAKGKGEAEDDVRIYRRVRVQLRRATRGGDQTLLILTDRRSRPPPASRSRSCIGGGGGSRRCSSSWKRTCTRK